MNNHVTQSDLVPITGDTFIPPTAEELAAVLGEAVGNPRLASYLEFVKKYGYSTFDDNVCYESITPLPEYLSDDDQGLFEMFFGGYTEDHDAYSLTWNKKTAEGRVPADLVPIGNDGGASLICIGVSGERLGKIYCWTYEEEPLDEETYLEDFGEKMPEEEKYANVFLLAESFDDFWNSLTVASEEDEDENEGEEEDEE